MENKSEENGGSQPTVKVKHRGTLKIGAHEIPCFVLADGTRVISGRGMTNAIGMRGRGQGIQRITSHGTLKPFIDNDLSVAMQKPIYLDGSGSRKSAPAEGYEATILLKICEAILDARDAGALKTDQENRYAKFCEILVRAFAKVGIIALIDEATGYQDSRPRKALEEILEKFIRLEFAKWAKCFPDEFYEQMFRLRGWPYSEATLRRRPGVVGRWTKDIVYARLAPAVLEDLELKNPVTQKGYRKVKHHQWLTDDVGHPRLREHLAVVIALMQASTNWAMFNRLLSRAKPKYMETLSLFPDLGDDEDDLEKKAPL